MMTVNIVYLQQQRDAFDFFSICTSTLYSSSVCLQPAPEPSVHPSGSQRLDASSTDNIVPAVHHMTASSSSQHSITLKDPRHQSQTAKQSAAQLRRTSDPKVILLGL